jgi:hypothetical protein
MAHRCSVKVQELRYLNLPFGENVGIATGSDSDRAKKINVEYFRKASETDVEWYTAFMTGDCGMVDTSIMNSFSPERKLRKQIWRQMFLCWNKNDVRCPYCSLAELCRTHPIQSILQFRNKSDTYLRWIVQGLDERKRFLATRVVSTKTMPTEFEFSKYIFP